MIRRRDLLISGVTAATAASSVKGTARAQPCRRQFDAEQWLRALEKGAARLDRYEPDLGLVLSADHRDTTSPLAMAQLVRRITTGRLLSPASRDLLVG